MRPQHIIPVGDGFSHNRSSDCPCGPEVLDGGIVVHQALDGRA